MLYDSFVPLKDDIVPAVRKLLGQGKTQQEIADELNVSRSTIQRVMPLVRSEVDQFEPMTFIEAIQMNDQGSPSVLVPTKSFMAMVDKSLPILYPSGWNGRGEVKQYQQNVILRWNPNSTNGKIILQDFEKWYNYMEKYGLENDHFVNEYLQAVGSYLQACTRDLRNHIQRFQSSWFGKAISSLGISGLTLDAVVEYFLRKTGEHLPKKDKVIYDKIVVVGFQFNLEIYIEILTNNPNHSLLRWERFLEKNMKNPAREILTEVGGIPEDLVDHMIELKKYDIDELKLILDGGFKNEEDIEFAKAGGFLNMKEVRKARKLHCNDKKELQQVVEHGWADGNEMRHAISRGFRGIEHELYTKTVIQNNHLRWNKSEIAWARRQTDTTLKRLSDFSSIRALDFCDFLLDVQEPVYRTDRLMEEHNKLTSPGRKISNESKFEEFLDEFSQYVEVTAGGLTKILLNSDKTLKVEPRVSPNDFPSLKTLNTKLAKDLKKALTQNNLNQATADAYAFMKYQLKKHVETGEGEDLMVVDEVEKLLNLNKQSISTLHQARLARNWVSHKESEQKIAPRWKYVEITLSYAQQLSEIEN